MESKKAKEEQKEQRPDAIGIAIKRAMECVKEDMEFLAGLMQKDQLRQNEKEVLKRVRRIDNACGSFAKLGVTEKEINQLVKDLYKYRI